ncbi:MAG TPA: hypothetical protein VJS68_01830, partial [Thermoplasmata archaeon]|nr:hypothetical protein [Thermoplasmata archaeon]
YLGGVSLTNYTLAWSSSDGRSLQTHLSPQVTSYALPASPPGTVFTLSLQANNMAGSGTPVTLSVTFPGPLPTNALVGFFASPLGVTVILVLVGLASALTGYSLSVRRTRRRRGGPAG